MAQYDNTAAISEAFEQASYSQSLKNAVSSLLSQFGDNASGQQVTSVQDAQASTADALFLRLDEGQRGTTDAPIVFDDSGREGGRAYVFEGDDGVVAQFNTVERVIIGTNGDDSDLATLSRTLF